MPITFYGHRFSAYCQKALVAFYEHGVDYTLRAIDFENPEILSEFEDVWRLKRMPAIIDDGRTLVESTIIIEYIDVRYNSGHHLIPQDPEIALETRFMDRFFDNYVSTPQMTVVFDVLREQPDRDPYGVNKAIELLETSYGWLNDKMASRHWAAGDDFTLADCAAGPALFYAHWTHPIDRKYSHLHAYRDRLMERPSFARCIEEARPYRHLFPLEVVHMD
ncbi:MAG: glutathione S-transferase family protein [Thalassospira sp.]|uniref:glutathione S-transferase family protein n=1 Tax=Thalassospira sp. TaxID=1912094 RepID=UPI0032EFC36F